MSVITIENEPTTNRISRQIDQIISNFHAHKELWAINR